MMKPSSPCSRISWPTKAIRRFPVFLAMRHTKPSDAKSLILVILDMQMEQPDSGLVVLELIRLDPTTEHIPVIKCSADQQFLRAKEDQLRAHRCDVLEKPYSLSELLTLITK